MFSTEMLMHAYAEVVKTKGANTKEGDGTNLDGINLDRVEKLSESLMDGS